MIVTYTEQGWKIITQRAHGLLAAQVAMNWRSKDRPQRWAELLVAIADHDDAQVELEADDVLTPTGGPVNFAMKKFDEQHCQRLHNFSLSKSRYIALLTSVHMVFLHSTEAKSNTEAAAFVAEQEKLQREWLKDLKISRKEVEFAYGIMEWCDAFSLLLAQNEVQPEGRVIEVSQGPDNTQYKLMSKANGALTVKPWPFEDSPIRLTLESRLIPQLQFKNCAEFKEQFNKAEVTEHVWQLEK